MNTEPQGWCVKGELYAEQGKNYICDIKFAFAEYTVAKQ